MMNRLFRLTDEAKQRLAEHWSRNLDDGAKRTLHWHMDLLNSKVCYNAFLYVAEQYTCWFFDESSSRWIVENPSAALTWMLRWTFWYDDFFAKEYQDVEF